MGQLYKLSDINGNVLIGEFDTYVEEGVDQVAGWFGPASSTSFGHIDFIMKGGPIISLEATNGMPHAWSAEPIG